MDKSEAKPNALETHQNADQANALKQKELEKGRDNITENQVLHEQYLQLKQTLEFRSFPFSGQHQNMTTPTLLKQHNEEQILEKCPKVDGINLNQQTFTKNPLSIMLWTLNCRGLLTQEFIMSFEKFCLNKMSKINKFNLQTERDNNQTIIANKEGDINLFINIENHIQPYISIKEQFQQTNSLKNQIINYQKTQSNYTLNSQMFEKQAAQEIIIDQFDHKNSLITYYAHAKFLLFLRKSMERLRVKKQIIKFCLENQTWPLGYNVIDFFRRLMAIKTFFSQLFPQIVNQFKIIIQEFMLKTKLKQDQIYARQILAAKYFKSIDLYSQNDNILEAAKCVYCVPYKQSFTIQDQQLAQRSNRNEAQSFRRQKCKFHTIISKYMEATFFQRLGNQYKEINKRKQIQNFQIRNIQNQSHQLESHQLTFKFLTIYNCRPHINGLGYLARFWQILVIIVIMQKSNITQT